MQRYLSVLALPWLILLMPIEALAQNAETPAPEPTPVATAAPEPVSAAQSLKLKVLAKGSGVPVARAEVKVGEEKFYTDKNGDVTLAIPAGMKDDIQIYRASFDTFSLTPEDWRGKTEFKAYIYPATPQDNEVTIRGAKRPETSRKTVSVEEAAKVAPGGDPAQVPRLLPGVQGDNFRPDIIVRGSGPNDSQYFVDDFTVPFIFHSIGNISIVPDQLLSDVEFSSGGFGAQYGGVTGGVINLRTKTTIPERASTEFRINLPFFSSLYHERPVEDGTAMAAVSVRRSYLEAILPHVIPKDSGFTVVPYFGDAHAFYVKPKDDGHFKVIALHAYDGLHALFPGDAAQDESGRGHFDMRTTASLLGVERKKVVDSTWSYTLSPHLVDIQAKMDIVGNQINFGGTGAIMQGEVTKRLGGKDRLYLGAQGTYYLLHADVYAPKPDYNDPFGDFEEAPKVKTRIYDHIYSTAVWTSMDKELGAFLLTPGVRLFYEDQIHKGSADPRLNVRYQLTKEHALKAAVGQYSQTPEIQQTDKNFGNPHLGFIRSYHYILGIETTWNDLWTTDFQTFYKENYDVVAGDPDTNTNNDGSLISYGFEAFVRRNLTSRFFGWLAYTYSKTRERENEHETFHTAQYDQTHVINLTGDYKVTAKYDVGTRVQYHTGQTFTAVDDAVYNANLDKYQPRQDPDSRLNNARLPAYHEVDLFSTYDFLFDEWKMSARFGVNFLALQRQAAGVQYNYDYSKTQYFRGIPPIPYIELRGVL